MWHVPSGNYPPTPTPYYPPAPPDGLTPRAYLPLINNNHPLYLKYWYQTQHVNQGLGDRPIWLTEIGGIGYCPLYPTWSADGVTTVLDYVMKPMAWWFNSDPNWTATFPDVPANPGYDSIEWFLPYSDNISETLNWWCTFLETSTVTSKLTILGDFWRSYNFTFIP